MIDKGSFSSLRQLSDCTQRTNNFYHSQSHFLYFSIFMVVPMKFISHLFTARIFKTHLLLKRSIIKSKVSVQFRVYGHTTEKCTGSRQITEVNLGRASIVLGWVTAWEQLVLQTFFFFLAENFGEYAMIDKGSFSSLRQLSDCTQRTNNFYHSQSHFLYFSIFMVVPMKFISHLFTARIFKTHLLLKRSIIKSKVSVQFRVYGHTTEKAPVLVRSPKLTSVGPAQYLDG